MIGFTTIEQVERALQVAAQLSRNPPTFFGRPLRFAVMNVAKLDGPASTA